MAKERFTGDTAMAPILGAKFWTKGTKLVGLVLGSFETRNGPCTTIRLNQPVELSGELLNPPENGNKKLEAISIGNMKGFESALRACGCGALKPQDEISIECTGTQNTGQKSDMVLFRVDVSRDKF
jgi:hypothetical protein